MPLELGMGNNLIYCITVIEYVIENLKMGAISRIVPNPFYKFFTFPGKHRPGNHKKFAAFCHYLYDMRL